MVKGIDIKTAPLLRKLSFVCLEFAFDDSGAVIGVNSVFENGEGTFVFPLGNDGAYLDDWQVVDDD